MKRGGTRFESNIYDTDNFISKLQKHKLKFSNLFIIKSFERISMLTIKQLNIFLSYALLVQGVPYITLHLLMSSLFHNYEKSQLLVSFFYVLVVFMVVCKYFNYVKHLNNVQFIHNLFTQDIICSDVK